MFLISCGGEEQKSAAHHETLEQAVSLEGRLIESIDENGFQDLVAQRNGKILFLNFWATWCQPCVEEFPDIVKLANEMSDKKVEFVAVSLDFPDEVESKILPFLQDKKVPFKVFVADLRDQDAFITIVNPSWAGALPATAIYDLNGQQQSFVVGQQSFAQFKRELQKLFVAS
ncbi:MAG: TlpA family protein disulfide reductase [Bacteroidota bacterium]